MQLDDSLIKPDYSTPGKKKQYVESQLRLLRDAFSHLAGDDTGGFLQSPYGERRKKAILSYLDRAEEEFKDFPLESVVESFVMNELNPLNNYNRIDCEADLRIAAALWILEKLRANGKLHEAFKILPDIAGNLDAWYLPDAFFHPCFDANLIQSVIHVITTRYGEQSEVLTPENAKGKQPDETWLQLLEMLPDKDVMAACDAFRTKIWDLVTRHMKGDIYYVQKIEQISNQLKEAQMKKITDAVMINRGSVNETGFPKVGGTAKIDYLSGNVGVGSHYSDKDTDDLSLEKSLMIDKHERFIMNFHEYLKMDKKLVRRETGSREVAEAVTGFRVEDPYELCFALFYLTDTGDDIPWLVRSGGTLMNQCLTMLPWYVDQDNWDDEMWDTWFEGVQYNQNGWLKKEAPPEQFDFFHDQFDGRNLAQIIYDLCRCVVPVGLHPFEEERKQLVEDGMEEEKARKIIDTAELLFLQSFQAKQFGVSEFSLPWDQVDRDEEDKPEADHGGKKLQDQADGPLSVGGYWGKVAMAQGKAVVTASPKEADDAENGITEEAYNKLKDELNQAKKQIKSLRNVLNNEKHAADAERAKYEHELKELRMEHRELADLRSLVFNQDAENPERLEKVEKHYSYPYETRKRTVVFGGHDSFLRVFKPMFPNVRFVDADNLAFSPEIIRNADLVWIQNNRISHPQYWNIVKYCKLSGVQMRYFGYASAEKCAEQLVTEDQK